MHIGNFPCQIFFNFLCSRRVNSKPINSDRPKKDNFTFFVLFILFKKERKNTLSTHLLDVI